MVLVCSLLHCNYMHILYAIVQADIESRSSSCFMLFSEFEQTNKQIPEVLLVFDKSPFNFSDPDSRRDLVSLDSGRLKLRFLFTLTNGPSSERCSESRAIGSMLDGTPLIL